MRDIVIRGGRVVDATGAAAHALAANSRSTMSPIGLAG